MNCIYVSDIFRFAGMETEVFTPFVCGAFTTLFSKDKAVEALNQERLFSLQEEPDTRIFLQIQVLYFVLLRLKQMQCFWQRQSMESMTVIQR